MSTGETQHPEIDAAVARLDRAAELQERGRFDEALAECQAAVAAFEEHDGPLSPDLANVLNTLSSINNKFDRAEYAEERQKAMEVDRAKQK